MFSRRAVLAFDYGASSGRAILGYFDNDKIELEEVHRFSNEPILKDGTLYWDFNSLFHEMLVGIKKAKEICQFESIGIDTWGVDFGLLDSNGKLIDLPVHYRDKRTNGISEEIASIIGKENFYLLTGTQQMDINTICQLYALKKYNKEIFLTADKLLLMPDLFNFHLTGKCFAEKTIASTTQMLDLKKKNWNTELLKRLNIPTNILPPIITSGEKCGVLSEKICKETGSQSVPVLSIASHDTASAIMAVPTDKKDFAFISCGTWSLFGTELDSAIINSDTEKKELTNELGFGSTSILMKNIIGLWLIQETKRQFKRNGNERTYAEMETMAKECKPFTCFIDPDDKVFTPIGDIPTRIRDYCRKTNQHVHETDGEVIRCIYESLAMKYRFTYNQIKVATGKNFCEINLVGGGTKDSFLCQLTADAANTDVVAGPVEATALGNIAAQLISLGYINNLKEARKIISKSFMTKRYSPKNADDFSKHYPDFLKLIK